ncbi:MAG TPA: gamma-glutamylcyclotransferase, partial [Candidatus Polarisedimenticolia bacterium]|nr:gamma-glutamylcyclotransferase [Candidatus Polarisedimenticolia bacterium]
EGVVEGDRFEEGWGAALGAPAFRPRAGGSMVSVHVLESRGLPAAWTDLDRFEGPEYLRILVPVFRADARTFRTVANLYAAAGRTP